MFFYKTNHTTSLPKTDLWDTKYMSSDKILCQDKMEGTYEPPAMLSSLTSSTLAAQVLYHFS